MDGPFAIPEPDLDGERVRAKAKVKRGALGHDALIFVTRSRVVVTRRPEAPSDDELPITIPLAAITGVTYRPTPWRVLAPSVALTITTDEERHEFALVPTLDPPSLRVAGGFRVTPVATEFVDAVIAGAGLRKEDADWLPGRFLLTAVSVVLIVAGLALVLAGALLALTLVLGVVALLLWAVGVPLLYVGARDLAAGFKRSEWRRGASGPEKRIVNERPWW